jgi:hypothetical protein
MAKAARKLSASIELAKVKPLEATFELPVKIDPDSIPPEEKVRIQSEHQKQSLRENSTYELT